MTIWFELYPYIYKNFDDYSEENKHKSKMAIYIW